MTNKSQIYLDYMATTPIDDRVIVAMLKCMGYGAKFGNPSSFQHSYGKDAAIAVEHAREQIANLVNAKSDEIIFTSGATEANNLAILGAARFYKRKGKHLITMQTEHKSCLDTFMHLEQEGFEVTYLKPNKNGLLDINCLKSALRDDTILVSTMHVNNEIGVIQDIEAIGNILQDKGIVFHVDAAQSAGKVKIDLQKLSVSLMSFSAHKNYGPKGVGALYIKQKPRIRIQAISFGGAHEKGMRSGTLATHQIVGMGEAFAISNECMINEQKNIANLKNILWNGIKDIPNIQLNNDFKHSIPGLINFSMNNLSKTSLIEALSELAVSSMSACTASSLKPSYVLEAIGLNKDLAANSIRLSIGRFTTLSDIEGAIKAILGLGE